MFGVLAAEPEDPGGGVLTAEWIIPPAEDGAAGGVAREAEEPDKAKEAALPPEAPPAWGGGVLAMLAEADAVAVVSSRAALGGLGGPVPVLFRAHSPSEFHDHSLEDGAVRGGGSGADITGLTEHGARKSKKNGISPALNMRFFLNLFSSVQSVHHNPIQPAMYFLRFHRHVVQKTGDLETLC